MIGSVYAPQYGPFGAIYATQFQTGLGPVNASLARSGMSRLDLIHMYEKAIAEKHARQDGEPEHDVALIPRKRKLMRRQVPKTYAPVMQSPVAVPKQRSVDPRMATMIQAAQLTAQLKQRAQAEEKQRQMRDIQQALLLAA